MPADRLHDGHAGRVERVAEVGGASGSGSAGSPRRTTSREALGDRLEVAAGQAAVGREALGQDQQVAALLGERRRRSSPASRRCWPARPSSRDIVMPSASDAHLARRCRATGRPCWPGSRSLDEPGVLGEAAGVEEQRDAVPVADVAHRAQVLEADRLAAAGVVGDGDHHQRDARRRRRARSAPPAPATSMLPLNGCAGDGLAALGDDQVDGLGAGELDVGAGGVEVGVVGHHLARPADHARTGSSRPPGPGGWG